MSSSSEDETLNPGATSDAKATILKLNSKSRNSYMRKYGDFMKWKKLSGAKCISEEVLLDYFKELAKSKQPPSLWAIHSMLKTTLSAKRNINIAEYSNLTAFIKEQAAGYKSQKSRVFSAADVGTFMKEAPDLNYLGVKVALIFGVNGACRNIEMARIKVSDVQKHSDQLILVNIMASPTKLERSFMVLDQDVSVVEKYMALRPTDLKTDRFFISYHLGKCRKQVIGKNYFQKYPMKIANYLHLPNPELYTGHCFRRTAARMYADPDRLGLRSGTAMPKDDMNRKKLELSPSTHSEGVTVKMERAESEVPFDFIDVKEPPQPQQPSPPPRRLRTLNRPNRLLRFTTDFMFRQLERDEQREREEHAREMQWLREEARRVEAEAECIAVLRRVADVALACLERPTVNGGVTRR